MVSTLDIYRAAKLLIDKHGEERPDMPPAEPISSSRMGTP